MYLIKYRTNRNNTYTSLYLDNSEKTEKTYTNLKETYPEIEMYVYLLEDISEKLELGV